MRAKTRGAENGWGSRWARTGAVALVIALWVALSASVASGAPVETIAGPGSAAGQVIVPLGAAVDQSSGDLYVADRGNLRIDKFDSEGNFLLAWGFGVADNESAELQTCGPQATPPTTRCFHTVSTQTNPGAGNIGAESVAVDQSSHDVYVADGEKRRVTKFGADGEFIFMIGKNVNASGVTPEERNICTAEDLEEEDQCGVGAQGTGAGEYFQSPGALLVDFEGRLWVADGSRLVVFDSSGHYLSEAPIPGGRSVNGIALDSIAARLYALEPDVNERQNVSFSGFVAGNTFTLGGLPAACSASSTAPITYSENNLITIIFNALAAQCGGNNISSENNPAEPSAVRVGFRDELAAQDFGQLTCTKNTGAGSCVVTTVSDGARARIEKMEPSGNPPSLLTPLESIDEAGRPAALVLDSEDNLYVGDATSPYRFLRYDSEGVLTSLFGVGQVDGSPRGNALATGNTVGALYVANGASGNQSPVQRFTLPEEGPLPEDVRAEGVLPTTAKLAAFLNPEGHETTYRFEYGTEESYGHETPVQTLSGTEFEGEEVQAELEALIPDTIYHFRIVATNHCKALEPLVSCTVSSPDATFTTPPAVAIDAQWASDVAAGSVTFKAELDPLGVPAEWRLEYGTSEGYGTATEFQNLGSGFGDVTVAKQITGLSPDTLYHYRFTARDERDGVQYLVHGPDQTVLTAIGALGFELPDDRAWEQVTPLHKGGGLVVPPWTGFTQASPDGSAFTFVSLGPVSETEGSRAPEPAQSLARPGPSGWSSEQIDPPQETARGLSGQAQYRLFSTDLSHAAVEVLGLRAKEPGSLSAEASERTPYLRENFLDPVRWRPLVSGCPLPPEPCSPVVEAHANVPPGTEFGGEEEEQLHAHPDPPVVVAGGSPDLDAMILKSRVPLTADAEGAKNALYEWSEGALELVSRLAGEGGKAVGEASLGSIGELFTGSADHAVSTGGDYVYWGLGGTSPTALYVRDTVAAETVRLDIAQPHSIGGQAAPFFQGASADGRHAFFTDTRHLTPDAGETGSDLYECEVIEVGGKDECLLRDLTPETEDHEAAGVQGIVSGIGEDGEDVYFVANGALAPGASPGNCSAPATPGATCSLYHAQREGGSWELSFVATLGNEDQPSWGVSPDGRRSSGFRVAATSPSGRYLAFMSDRRLTGYDNRDATSGEADEEAFRYDSVADALTCLSCNPSGARPRGVQEEVGAFRLPSDWGPEFPRWPGRWLAATLPDPEHRGEAAVAEYHPRVMLNNGRVLFNAFDSLVTADSNGTSDAYQYEPHGMGSCSPSSRGPAVSQAEDGGCVALLSSGTSERESAVIDSSASGNDVFIITASQLSPLDEDPDYDIYDVRVGGVPATREEHAECLGEACQSPPPAPNAPTPPTAAPAGDGNFVPPAPKPRCPKGKREVRRSGKAHCVKRQGRKHRSHHDRRGRRHDGRAHR